MSLFNYGVQDFSDARYNVLAIGNQKVIEAFPDLKKFPEFNFNYKKSSGLDHEKVLKYVLLLYTENILRRSVPDLEKRKMEAALLAGFERDQNKKFSESIKTIFKCENLDVNRLIIRVIRLNNSNAFEQLAVYEEARSRQMFKLLSPTTGDEKTKEIHENIRRMTSDIEDLERKLLMEEKSKDLIDSLYYEIENIQLGIRPEEIAEAKKAGALDSILDNPYKQDIPEMENIDLRPKRGRPRKNGKA
jgi:hypothetical protein